MTRFAGAARSLRGPFKKLVTKLDLSLRRVEVHVSRTAHRRFLDTDLHADTALRGAREEMLRIRTTTRKPRPRCVTAAVDRNSGRVVATAVPREAVSLPKVLRSMLPDPTLEPWKSANCGEVSAAAKAMRAGSRLEDLVIRTVKMGSGKILQPCKNCITWSELGG